VFGLALSMLPAWAADFAVRTPGDQFAFQINGVDSPTLTLVRGRAYTFDVQTSAGFHPFHIESPGVDVNDIDSGTITYTVPTNAVNYYYNCTVHGDTMRGEIVTVAPPVPADFVVRTPGDQFAFQINGVDSPTLTLVRGRTYTFDVQTSAGFHPFHIESSGVDTNDIDSGTITYTVPTNAANYFYDCIVHFGQMRGEIVTIDPPQPTFRILSLVVDSNIVLTSTGTNTWTLNPEFNTNLITTSWFALSVQTNRFMNGTNEIICGRPPGNAVFIRLRAQQNGP
jgi:plastocyanin